LLEEAALNEPEEGSRISTFLAVLNALESIELPPESARPHSLTTCRIAVRANTLHSTVGALVAAQRLLDPSTDIRSANGSESATTSDAKMTRRCAGFATRDERVVAETVVVETVLREDFPAPWVLRTPVADCLAATCRGRVGTRVSPDVSKGARLWGLAAVPPVLLVIGVLLSALEGRSDGAAFDVGSTREEALSRNC
jgi:hypothetical protein